jgi:hypothetical protein
VLETRSRVDVALRCLCPSEASLARRRWTRGRKRYTDEAHERAHAGAVWAAVVVVVCGREGGRNRGGGRGVQGGGSGGLLCDDDDDEPPPIPSHPKPSKPQASPPSEVRARRYGRPALLLSYKNSLSRKALQQILHYTTPFFSSIPRQPTSAPSLNTLHCTRHYALSSGARKVALGTFATFPHSACTLRKMTII